LLRCTTSISTVPAIARVARRRDRSSGMIAAIVDTFDTLVAPPPQGNTCRRRMRSTSIYKGRGTSSSPPWSSSSSMRRRLSGRQRGRIEYRRSGHRDRAKPVAPTATALMVSRTPRGSRTGPTKCSIWQRAKATPDEIYRIRHTLEYDAIRSIPGNCSFDRGRFAGRRRRLRCADSGAEIPFSGSPAGLRG